MDLQDVVKLFWPRQSPTSAVLTSSLSKVLNYWPCGSESQSLTSETSSTRPELLLLVFCFSTS
jgi:hypothetical protein